jgi:hypothetical protein
MPGESPSILPGASYEKNVIHLFIYFKLWISFSPLPRPFVLQKRRIFFFWRGGGGGGGGVIYTLYKKRNLFLCSSLLRASSWNAKAVSFKEKMPLYLASG